MAVFLDFDFNLSASTFHGASKSNIQISPSEPLDNVPLLIFKILAGFIVKASIILFSGRDSLWNISKDNGSNVSIPIAPAAAWLKGSLLLSSSSGKWSDTITSINPSFIPCTNANLSSSNLRGGDNFKNVLNSPMSFSFKDKLLIETPTVNFFPLFLFFFITSIDCLDEFGWCDICRDIHLIKLDLSQWQSFLQ